MLKLTPMEAHMSSDCSIGCVAVHVHRHELPLANNTTLTFHAHLLALPGRYADCVGYEAFLQSSTQRTWVLQAVVKRHKHIEQCSQLRQHGNPKVTFVRDSSVRPMRLIATKTQAAFKVGVCM